MEALSLAVQARVPTLIWGAPGTGKTSCVESLCRRLHLPVEVVIASVREPADLAGLPVLEGAGVRLAPPSWAVRLTEAGRGVLFLDEISTAPPAVQAALLRVVVDRAVGELRLPEEVAVVAAANPPEQAANGCELDECRHLAAHVLDSEYNWHGAGERFHDVYQYLELLRFEGGLEERRAELVGVMDDRPEWAHFGFSDEAYWDTLDQIAWEHPLLLGHVSGYDPGSMCGCSERFLWVYTGREEELRADIEALARRLGVPPSGQKPTRPAVVHIGHYPDDPDTRPVPLCGGQGICVRADYEGLDYYDQLNSGELTIVCPVCHEAAEPFRAFEALGD